MIKITVTDEGVPMIWSPEDWEILRTQYRILGSLCGTLPDFPNQESIHGLPLVLLPYEVSLLHEKKIARIVRYPSLTRAPGKGVKEEFQKYYEKICDEQMTFILKEKCKRDENAQMAFKSKVQPIVLDSTDTRKLRNSSDEANNINSLSLYNIAADQFKEDEFKKLTPIDNSLGVQTFTTYPWLRKEDACTARWTYPFSSKDVLRFKVFKDFWEKGFYILPCHKFGADFLIFPGDPCVFSAHFLVLCVEENAVIRPTDLAVLSRLGSALCKSVILACATDLNVISYQTLTCSIFSK